MSVFQNKFHSKLPNVQTTIFTIMSKMAHDYEAINLSQGFPNFPSDPKLISEVSKAMRDGYNQYAPMQGIYSLRETISEKMNLLYGKTYHPESEITVTVGATQAIFTAITAFIRPKDEVILFKPAYDCYEPAIEVNGGVPILVQLQGKKYTIDWNLVKQKITDKTKMIILNTPHNPTGTIIGKSDLVQLQELVKDTNIIILSDEVYEHIIFDGEQHQSIALYPELAKRAFICASFGKTFHNTGWKMGYCVAPKELMHEFQKVHQFNVFCVNHPMQKAFASYLKTPENYLSLPNFYQKKRDLFLNCIRTSRFKFTPSKGTYFQLLEYADITNEKDVDFAKRLCQEFKLAAIPISVFNINNQDHKQLRFCFAKTDETLEKAAAILSSI
ncbi:MAG: methionine aminotransferase [Cellulophaga sp.]